MINGKRYMYSIHLYNNVYVALLCMDVKRSKSTTITCHMQVSNCLHTMDMNWYNACNLYWAKVINELFAATVHLTTVSKPHVVQHTWNLKSPLLSHSCHHGWQTQTPRGMFFLGKADSPWSRSPTVSHQMPCNGSCTSYTMVQIKVAATSL